MPGVLFLLLALLKSPVLTIPVTMLLAGMKLLRAPLLSDLMNQLIASRHRAIVLSGVSMLEHGVIFLLYPLVGWLADHSLNASFLFLGGITIAFALVSQIRPARIRPGL
jgi:hypothetical protein